MSAKMQNEEIIWVVVGIIKNWFENFWTLRILFARWKFLFENLNRIHESECALGTQNFVVAHSSKELKCQLKKKKY